MRSSLVVLAFWATGCSVYDDAHLRSDPSSPAPLTAASPAPSQGSAGHGETRPPLDGGTSEPTAPSGSPCVQSAGTDFCVALPILGHTPAIEGAVECGLPLAALAAEGWKGPAPEPNRHASFAAAWRPDGLYVYVEVAADTITPHAPGEPIFCGDAVELYVDADATSDDAGTYDATGTMQFVVAAPSPTDPPGAPVDAWRFRGGESQGAWISEHVAVARQPAGYSLEAFITAADLGLWEWNLEARVGFSVAIDAAQGPPREEPDEAGCTQRSGQLFLRLAAPRDECPGEPWCDAKAFCTPELLP